MPGEPSTEQLEKTVPASWKSSGDFAPVAISLPTKLSERYIGLKVHDQGGMGRIWLALDTGLDREVAVKELLPERAQNSSDLARFLREARITGQLEHPGIVPVYELGQISNEEHPFYAMRFVRGKTFSQASKEYHKLRKTKEADLELSTLLHAFVTVCNTISYAHSRGVIHRDLKGQNVILGDFGEVVVLDWGLAKVVNMPEIPVEPAAQAVETENVGLTESGLPMGSPPNMAPEQAAGRLEQIDYRTDIYGLGSILYEILTGKTPFSGPSSFHVLRKVLTEAPVAPREIWPKVPRGLEAICLQALAKEPGERFSTAKELADAVQQWQESERRQAEQALRTSEEQYRTLADLIPGIVWTARGDGWIDYANQFWFGFTGLTLEQTQGSGWAAVVHPDDVDRVVQRWTRALETGDPVEVDYRLRRTDGAYRWFLAQAKPVRDQDGKVFKWFGMLTEIDDQKLGVNTLERRHAHANLLHQVTIAAYEATSIEAALQAAIDRVCAHTGWPVGHVYIRAGASSAELLPTTIWHLKNREEFESFVRVTEAMPLASGAGLPGRVLASNGPVWVMDVTKDDNFPRASAAANLGVQGAFAFPVSTTSGVIAVLEFFTNKPKEPDDELLRAMAQIGLELGQVFERRQAKSELQIQRLT